MTNAEKTVSGRVAPELYTDPAEFKKAREALGLSQTALANAMGVGGDERMKRQRISRYERNASAITGPVARLMWFFMKYGVPKNFSK